MLLWKEGGTSCRGARFASLAPAGAAEKRGARPVAAHRSALPTLALRWPSRFSCSSGRSFPRFGAACRCCSRFGRPLLRIAFQTASLLSQLLRLAARVHDRPGSEGRQHCRQRCPARGVPCRPGHGLAVTHDAPPAAATHFSVPLRGFVDPRLRKVLPRLAADNVRERVAAMGSPDAGERRAIAQRDGHPEAGAAAGANAWAGTRAERPASRSYSATSWPLKTSTSSP